MDIIQEAKALLHYMERDSGCDKDAYNIISRLVDRLEWKPNDRLADVLCFARKYETREDAEIVKRVLVKYLAALEDAQKQGKSGLDTLPPVGDK